MFSNLSSSSISLATVTPSLVTVGAPKLLSSTTLRPLGPSITVTASARTLTPLKIFSLASCENLTIFAAIAAFLLNSSYARKLCGGALLDYPENVVFTKDDQIVAFQFDLASRVLAEEDFVPS